MEALKFMYWRNTGANLPIFVIPSKDRETYHTSKQLTAKGMIVEIPENYRVYEQDVYPEDTISFMQKQVQGRTVLKYLKQRAENYARESEAAASGDQATAEGRATGLEQLLNQDIHDSTLPPEELKIVYAARDGILRATKKSSVFMNSVDRVAELSDFKIKRLIG